MPFNLRKIEYALAVAENRSFSRAAEALKISQPTITRSIQSLEQEIGARIFDRSRAGVSITAAGQLLLDRGAALAASALELQRDLKLLKGVELGQISIGAGPYPAAISVGHSVGELLARHPMLEVDVRVGGWLSLRQQVLDRQLDLSVAELSGIADDQRFEVQPCEKHRAVLICRNSHPVLHAEALTLQDIRNFPLVSTVLPGRMRMLPARRESGPHGDDLVVPTVRVDTMGLVMDIVAASDAIGIAMPVHVLPSVQRGDLAVLALDLPFLKSNYGIIRLAGRTPSPAAEAFTRIALRCDSEAQKKNAAAERQLRRIMRNQPNA
ncbi:MAG: LysR family transcriptional regulator [Chromatiales bacterium]|jgi:DNA-binding transcriptional LysR family regulator